MPPATSSSSGPAVPRCRLRATAPEGWAETEDALWQAFAANAPPALRFIDDNTPLTFVLAREPDPFSEYPGGKVYGRQLTVEPMSKWPLGPLARRVRSSTLVHHFSYREMVSLDPYRHPVAASLEVLPRLAWRALANSRGQGSDQDFPRGQSAWDRYTTHGEGVPLTRRAEPPFVAVEVGRSILGTEGGARTDARGRVLRPDGGVIEGLYAAGLAMANPFGTRAVGAGTTLGPNLTRGFIGAETALAQATDRTDRDAAGGP